MRRSFLPHRASCRDFCVGRYRRAGLFPLPGVLPSVLPATVTALGGRSPKSIRTRAFQTKRNGWLKFAFSQWIRAARRI